MKKLLLSALFIGFAFGCSNNDNRDEVANNDVILPVKTIITENGTPSFGIIKYNGAKLSEIVDEDGSKEIVQYEGDNISKMTGYNADGKMRYEAVYTYLNGKIAKEVRTINYDNDKRVETSNYTWVDANHAKVNTVTNMNPTPYLSDYYFSNGNLVKFTNTNNIIITYTYDNTNNPFKNIKGMQALFESDYAMNNLVKKETSAIMDGVPSIDTTTYTYEFNKNNYPTKKVAKSKGSTDPAVYEEVIMYEYNK